MHLLSRKKTLNLGVAIGLGASLLLSAGAFARPAFQDPLGVYPENTVAFTADNFRPVEMLKGVQGLPLEMREGFQELLKEVVVNANKTGKGSLLKALQSISGHTSMAYRTAPEGFGELLFQIEARDINALQQILNPLKNEFPLKTSAFSDYTLYTILLSELAGPELDTLKITLAQQGRYIRGSIGETDRGLKEMLYLRRVHSVNSPWRLSGQNDVKRAKQFLSPKGEQWTYFRSEQARQALIQHLPNLVPAKKPPKLNGPWVQDAVNFAEGIGFNLSTSSRSATINAYTQHNTASLSDFQKEYIRKQKNLQSVSFAPLLGHFKAPLTALMTGHFSGLEDLKSIPSEHKLPKALQELSDEIDTDNLVKAFQKQTGLNYRSDLEPFIAGPFAWGLLPLSTSEKRLRNDMGAVIEIRKKAGNFAEHLARKVQAKKLKRISNTSVYKIELSKIEKDIAIIGDLFPGLIASEQGPPTLFFAQQASHLLMSNHLNALKDMLNTHNASHPYFKAQTNSQSHVYLNIQSLFTQTGEEIADTKDIKDYIKHIYATQQESLAATTNKIEFATTDKAKPWLKITENTSLPFALLSAIALPNFIGAKERALTSATKANMHTFQILVETYAIDWGGVYPPSLVALEKEAKKNAYWRDVENPYNKSSGENNPAYASINDYDRSIPGQVILDFKQPLLYQIYGTGKYGDFIKDKKKHFILSNA